MQNISNTVLSIWKSSSASTILTLIIQPVPVELYSPLIQVIPGVYIKFEIHIFAPPPFLSYIFSPTEIHYNQGVCAAEEKFVTLFLQFCIF